MDCDPALKEIFKKDWRPVLRWHVIRSKHRNEHLLCQQLLSREIEAYYPCIRLQSNNLHARKIKPYFPGYMFVHTDLDVVGKSSVQWIPGAVGLVCFGGEAAWVADGILQGIRERVDEINLSGWECWQNLKPGDDISIHSGLFAGYRGIFSSYLSDRERVIVFLKFVRDQQVRVELPAGQVTSIKKHLQA
jgi:transcriptional antiterminator RfaH